MARQRLRDKFIHADNHDWNRGVLLIAGIVCIPVALVALVRLLVG